MPLLRYRMKDIVKVINLRDEETGVNLPHIVFQHRVGETIDLAGLARLDEKTIWQVIANTGLKYIDWVACKEYDHSESFLHLYLELREEESEVQAAKIGTIVDEKLKIVDTDYKDIDAYLKLRPVKVTLLSPGSFQRYTDEKVREGADLAHLKPMHMNPPHTVIKRVLQLSEVVVRKC
jgi:phenylacetate-coenzyme A ligase PaaK-like adenylate-forming protein